MAPERSERRRTPGRSGVALGAHRGLRMLRLAAAALLCVVTWAGCVRGPTPSRRGGPRTYPVQLFGLTKVGGKVFIRGELSKEDNRTAGTETVDKERLFEEGVELHNHGYIYHPNLIDWDATFRLSLNQEKAMIGGVDSGGGGTIRGYDISALILQEKPVSLRLFISRDQTLLDRDFGRRVQSDRSRQGFEIFTKGSFPASLTVERLAVNEESDLRTDQQRTTNLRFSIADQRNPDWFTELTYEREDTDETSSFVPFEGGSPTVQELPVTRDELTLVNRWRFGSGPDKHSLTGLLRYIDQGGIFPNKILSIQQRLDLVHSATFSTFFSGLFNLDETDTDKDRVIRGDIGFAKSIYESLDLAGRVTATDRQFANGSERILEGVMDTRYRKKTALGLLTSSLSLGLQRENEQSAGGQRSVRNESVTLTGLSFSTLAAPNIVPGTIFVTNLAETVIYVEGVDYVLQTIGAFTEIARRVGGTIADGETVLVDYTATVATQATFSTTTVGWSNRLRLKSLPLSLYFDYRTNQQKLLSGDDPGNLETQTTKLVGIELDWAGLTAAAEHESEYRELSPPSTTDRFRLDYHRRLGRAVNLSLGGRAESGKFSKADEFGLGPGEDRLDILAGNARLTMKLARSVLGRLEADYSRSRGRDNTVRAGLGLGLDGTFRSIDFSVEARHDIYEQESTQRTGDQLRFNITRRF